MTSFLDLIKKSALEAFGDGVSIKKILISIIIAFFLGLFVLFIYKITFTNVLFSKGLALSLVMLTMISAMIIVTITSNLALSLGMVGALSIVRFRTAVKDPADTAFMFWAIAAGIATGAGYYIPAIAACFLVGILFFILSKLKFAKNYPYLLVVRYDPRAYDNIQKVVKAFPKYKIKSKNVNANNAEIAVEVALEEKHNKVVEAIARLDGVIDVNLISYQGDYGL